MSQRIAVVGAGAIGSYFGAHMVRAGLDVTLIDAWPENVEQVRRHGIKVSELTRESFTVSADIRHVGDVQGMVRERPIDLAFIAVKSYDTAWATQLILPYLGDRGVVASLQNAINEGTIASVAGAERTYGCAINALSCELTGPGHVVRMSPSGDVSVGAVEGADPGRRAEIAAALSPAETSKPIDNLIGVKWSKLVINSMRNGLSGMTGMTGRERDSDPLTIELGMRLGAQAVRIGRALGHELVNTGYDFDTLVQTELGDASAIDAIRRRMAEISGARSGEQRPSMAQDISKNRRTETDAINGFIARKGREVGIEATPHQKVHELILRIERGELRPSRDLAQGIV